MNVSAKDKGSGKSDSIVIKNERGRLSKEDFERMVADAEKFKEADEKIRKNVESKNKLEGYARHVKDAVEDDKVRTSSKVTLKMSRTLCLGCCNCHVVFQNV